MIVFHPFWLDDGLRFLCKQLRLHLSLVIKVAWRNGGLAERAKRLNNLTQIGGISGKYRENTGQALEKYIF